MDAEDDFATDDFDADDVDAAGVDAEGASQQSGSSSQHPGSHCEAGFAGLPAAPARVFASVVAHAAQRKKSGTQSFIIGLSFVGPSTGPGWDIRVVENCNARRSRLRMDAGPTGNLAWSSAAPPELGWGWPLLGPRGTRGATTHMHWVARATLAPPSMDSKRALPMNSDHDKLPLTLADLERVRADLEDSMRHTEAMLERTEALLLAAALLSHGNTLDLMQAETRNGKTVGPTAWRMAPPRASTN